MRMKSPTRTPETKKRGQKRKSWDEQHSELPRGVMELALASTGGRLRPEAELGRAVSAFEAALDATDRAAFRAQRESSARLPPGVRDVMYLTAQIDQRARREGSGAHRCFGPRFAGFLEAVQQYTAVGDVLIGGSQNLLACGVWALVRMTFLVRVLPSYAPPP